MEIKVGKLKEILDIANSNMIVEVAGNWVCKYCGASCLVDNGWKEIPHKGSCLYQFIETFLQNLEEVDNDEIVQLYVIQTTKSSELDELLTTEVVSEPRSTRTFSTRTQWRTINIDCTNFDDVVLQEGSREDNDE